MGQSEGRPELEFKILPFQEWRKKIAPLWNKESRVDSIYAFLNANGQMQYVGSELFSKVLLFPIAACMNGKQVGWTSCYNISDSCVRIRGLYVLPGYRDQGIGFALVQHAMKLWPSPWNRFFMVARLSNHQRYRRWGFDTSPGFSPRTFYTGKELGEPYTVLMQHDRA